MIAPSLAPHSASEIISDTILLTPSILTLSNSSLIRHQSLSIDLIIMPIDYTYLTLHHVHSLHILTLLGPKEFFASSNDSYSSQVPLGLEY